MPDPMSDKDYYNQAIRDATSGIGEEVSQLGAPSMWDVAFSPFTLAHKLGAAAVGNLMADTEEEEVHFGDAGWREWGELLGYDKERTGLYGTDADSGGFQPIQHGKDTGTMWEGILRHKYGDEQLSEKFAGPYGGLWKAGVYAGNVGIDPSIWFGLGSGVKALTAVRGAQGLIPLNKWALGLRGGGIEDVVKTMQAAGKTPKTIQAAVRARLGRAPGFMEQLAGIENPYEFFQKGWLFNKNPSWSMTADTISNVGKSATATRKIPVEDVGDIPTPLGAPDLAMPGKAGRVKFEQMETAEQLPRVMSMELDLTRPPMESDVASRLPYQPVWYHGTKSGVPSIEQLDVLGYSNPSALYGPGAYLTSSREVAEGYAKTKGQGKFGRVLQGVLPHDIKLIDIDKPLPFDVRKMFRDFGAEYDLVDLDFSKPGKDIYREIAEALSSYSHNERVPGYEIGEILQDFFAGLKKRGYSGFEHIGGQLTKAGKRYKPHRVNILWADIVSGKLPITAPSKAMAMRLDVPKAQLQQIFDARQEASKRFVGRLRVGKVAEAGEIAPRLPEVAPRPSKMVLDAMPEAQVFREAQAMVKNKHLYGEMADKIAKTAAANTLMRLRGRTAIEGKSALGLIRRTLAGRVKKVMHKTTSQYGGMKYVPEVKRGLDVAVNTQIAKLDDQLHELIQKHAAMSPGAPGRMNVADDIYELRQKMQQLRHSTEIERVPIADWQQQKGLVDTADDIRRAEQYSLRLGKPDSEAAFRSLQKSPHIKTVEQTADGLRLTMKNGAKGIVRWPDEITTAAGRKAAGRFVLEIDGVGRIDLSKVASIQTPDHEMVHWAKALGLFSDDEWTKLSKKFASGVTDIGKAEELIADGLAASRFKERGIIRRVMDWFRSVYDTAIGRVSAEGVERTWRKGKVWERPVTTPGVPIKPKYSLPEMPTIDKIIESEHIRATKEPKGRILRMADWFEQIATSKAARGEVWEDFLEAWQNYYHRGWTFVKKAQQMQTGKKAGVIGGKRASLTKRLQALPGLLQRAKLRILREGIEDPANLNKFLWKATSAEDALKPANKYLKKHYGKIRIVDQNRMGQLSDSRMVARRVLWMHGNATEAIEPFIEVLAKGGDVTEYSPLVFRQILSANDLEQIRALNPAGEFGQEAVRQFLTKKVDDWGNNMVGLGAAQGREGQDLAIVREVMAETAGEIGDVLDEMAQPTRDMSHAMNKYAYLKGRITKAKYDYLETQSGDYATLHRVFDPEQRNLMEILKGSKRAVLAPVTEMIEMAADWKKQIDRNDFFAAIITDIDKANLKELGFTKIVKPSDATKDSIKIWVKGVPSAWTAANPKLLASLNRIGSVGPMHPLVEMVGTYTRLVKYFITRSPGFMLYRNPVRDTVSRAILSESGSRITDVLKRFSQAEIESFVRIGGDQAGHFGDIKQNYARDMAQACRRTATEKKTTIMHARNFGDWITGAVDKWSDIGSFGERQNRLAEFQSVFKKVLAENPGIDKVEAAIEAAGAARDLADFAIVGEYGRYINAFVPFFNPAVQGMGKMLRAARNDSLNFAKKTALYVTIPAIGNYLYNKSVGAGDEYLDLPAYRRDMFWNFKVGDHWIVIPKPFEQGVLGTLGERAVDLASGNKKAMRGWGGSMLKGMSPVDESMLAGPFKPLIELATNKDLFMGRYIVPPHEEGLDKRLRWGVKRASGVGKLLANTVGELLTPISPFSVDDPRQWEHVLSSMFGDFGRLAITATSDRKKPIDVVSRTLGGIVRPSSPYALQSIQDVLGTQKRLGVERKKKARKFRKALRKVQETRSHGSVIEILAKARKERERLSKIKLEDIARKRERKSIFRK